MDKVGQAWTEWLTSFGFDYFATYTFAPKEDRVVGPVGAFAMQKRYFGRFQVPIGYFSVAEDHAYRDDVHLHTLVKIQDVSAKEMWAEWEHGRSRILLLNDNGAGYCAKYLQKQSDVPIDFKMK